MKLIICLDNRNGLFFNNRRLSRDSAVISSISEITKLSNLYIRNYSANLFSDNCIVEEKPFTKAQENDFVFIEDIDPSDSLAQISELYVYRWNRDYPSDVQIEIPVDFVIENSIDFQGTSHDKITLEKYVRIAK